MGGMKVDFLMQLTLEAGSVYRMMAQRLGRECSAPRSPHSELLFCSSSPRRRKKQKLSRTTGWSIVCATESQFHLRRTASASAHNFQVRRGPARLTAKAKKY